MAPETSRSSTTAIALMQATVRLRGRLRQESQPSPDEISMPQAHALARIIEHGPVANATLAAMEHVRPQSMNETVRELHARGLVDRHPDPHDGRKVLMTATPDGRRIVESILAARHAWLAAAIDDALSPAERDTLAAAAALMDRLAAS
jgi:DNA-binding MarR family transcriptional regulator